MSRVARVARKEEGYMLRDRMIRKFHNEHRGWNSWNRTIPIASRLMKPEEIFLFGRRYK